MKRALVILTLLVACGSDPVNEPISGVVSRLEYDDPDPDSVSTTCTGINMKGELTTTTCYEDDPAHWRVAVATSADRVRLIEVTEAEYERCRIGASFAEGRCIG